MVIPFLIPMAKFAASFALGIGIDLGLNHLFGPSGTEEAVEAEPDVFMIVAIAAVTFLFLHLLLGRRRK